MLELIAGLTELGPDAPDGGPGKETNREEHA
jgi:hypothetical protein